MRRRRRVSSKQTVSGFALLAILVAISHPIILIFVLLCIGILFGIWMYTDFRKRENLRRSGIHQIDQMTGKDFEQYLAVLFRSLGYKVQLTRASGDFGADLVLQKDGTRIVVQAKRYNKPVGVKAVQEVNAAMAHYGAVEGWVVTNTTYTQAAITLARSNKIRLFDRQNLINLIIQVQKQTGNSSGQLP